MKTLARALPYGVAYLLPVVCGTAIALRGPWLWLPPVFLFVITPLLDQLCGQMTAPLEDESAARRWRDLRYDLWLYLWVPVQLALQVAAVVFAVRTDLASAAGLVFAAGFVGGIGINVGHELMHRKGRFERALAEILLASVSYTHFCVEHVLGHHKNVSTHDDPATARKGEPLPAFWLRSISGGLKSAWQLEGARVRKQAIPLGFGDRRVRYPLELAFIVAALAITLGPVGVVAFVGQAVIAILLLETINYLEHYGLARAPLADGTFERVAPQHSWSSAHRLTSLYLFNLTRHADHHAHASRPYFALRHMDEGPKLPWGYATMLVLALVPPLWRRVVDPLVPPQTSASLPIGASADQGAAPAAAVMLS